MMMHAAITETTPLAETSSQPVPPTRLRIPEIVFLDDFSEAMGHHRTTTWRWIRDGLIDPPQLFGNRPGWTIEYYRQWIATRPRLHRPQQPEALKPYSVKGQPRRKKKAATEPQAVTA